MVEKRASIPGYKDSLTTTSWGCVSRYDEQDGLSEGILLCLFCCDVVLPRNPRQTVSLIHWRKTCIAIFKQFGRFDLHKARGGCPQIGGCRKTSKRRTC